MTVKTTTDPKKIPAVAPTAGHDCCGGDAIAEPRSKASESADAADLGHVNPSKAAETCCCGGAGKK